MRPRIKRGDQYRVDAVTTTDGLLARDVTVTITAVQRVGCGCTRLATQRPGPAGGPLAGPMHLHVDRCVFHQANDPDGVTARAFDPERAAE